MVPIGTPNSCNSEPTDSHRTQTGFATRRTHDRLSLRDGTIAYKVLSDSAERSKGQRALCPRRDPRKQPSASELARTAAQHPPYGPAKRDSRRRHLDTDVRRCCCCFAGEGGTSLKRGCVKTKRAPSGSLRLRSDPMCCAAPLRVLLVKTGITILIVQLVMSVGSIQL